MRFTVSCLQKYNFKQNCEFSSLSIMMPHFMTVRFVALGFSNSSVCTKAMTVQLKKNMTSTKLEEFKINLK
jgi:hypothetical protein